MVAHAHELGFPVAIHAVERDAVVASALAIRDAPPVISGIGSLPLDRIEHCSECPPDVLELVAHSGAMVVTNPGFLHYDGERYRRTVATDQSAASLPGGGVGLPGSLHGPWLRRSDHRAESVGVHRGFGDSPSSQWS